MDGHNQLRQGVLRLEKFWVVKKWPKRMLTSMLSSCLVDAFGAGEFYNNPPTADNANPEFQSRVIAFPSLVVGSLVPSVAGNDRSHWGNRAVQQNCVLEKMGMKTVHEEGSKNIGRQYREAQRCAMCSKAKRFHKNTGRAIKTIWRCATCPGDICICPAEKPHCLAEHKTLVAEEE